MAGQEMAAGTKMGRTEAQTGCPGKNPPHGELGQQADKLLIEAE